MDVLGWAKNDYNHDIHVDTCGFSKQVVSTFGVPIIVDKEIDEIDVAQYDALAIPGGFEEFGFYEEAYDERFLELIRSFDRQGKFIAAICVAALPLGKSGILEHREATTYHLQGGHRQRQLADFGVHVVQKPVVVDQKVVTSYCPVTGPYVAFELLRYLIGTEAMLEVKRAMGYADLEETSLL